MTTQFDVGYGVAVVNGPQANEKSPHQRWHENEMDEFIAPVMVKGTVEYKAIDINNKKPPTVRPQCHRPPDTSPPTPTLPFFQVE